MNNPRFLWKIALQLSGLKRFELNNAEFLTNDLALTRRIDSSCIVVFDGGPAKRARLFFAVNIVK